MLSLLVAVSQNGVIGNEGTIPWHVRSDLKRFRLLTEGGTVIMGRKTHDSILSRNGKPLPKRRSLVITRQTIPGMETLGVEGLQTFADQPEEIFVIGGSQIYALAMPYAKRLYLTRVHADVEGDAFFPGPHMDDWKLESTNRFEANEHDQYPFSFEIYTRQ